MKLRKSLCLVLAMILLLGSVPSVSFAQGEEEQKVELEQEEVLNLEEKTESEEISEEAGVQKEEIEETSEGEEVKEEETEEVFEEEIIQSNPSEESEELSEVEAPLVTGSKGNVAFRKISDPWGVDAQLAELKFPVNSEETVFIRWDPKTEEYIIYGNGEIEDWEKLREAFMNLIVAAAGVIGEAIPEETEENMKVLMDYYKRIGLHEMSEEGEQVDGKKFITIESGVSLPEDSTQLFSNITIPRIAKITFPKDLDTSNVTNMSYMFAEQELLDPDVANWDVSNVVNMEGMFSMTGAADPDVSKWDVSNLENAYRMFEGAEVANPDVSQWDMRNASEIGMMFAGTKKANPDVSNWQLPKVKKMLGVFYMSEAADPDLSNWHLEGLKFSQNMFYDSNVKEVDIRNWHYSKLNGYSTAGMFYNTHKLQYIYLPAGFKDENGHDGYSTFMAADFKKQVDGEKASPIIEGSHKDYYFNADETRDTLFFVPQNLKVKVAWEDEDIPDKTRPESVEISLLANGASLKEYATMTQVEAETVTMKEENLWETTYSDLDIFHDGKKIEYSVAQAPKDIDDYITIYEPKGLVTPNKNKAGDYDIKVRNIYKTIIEQIGPDKPLTPHNFVKVTVDTTNKATYATKFNRTFWVTPNREVTIDVKEPVGKIIGGVMYEFKGWESEDGQKWEKGSKIKGTFKEETKIVAVYEEKYIPIIPQIPNPQIPDNPMGSMLLYPSTPSLETQNNEQVLNHEAYIKGYPDNSIRADGFITRAETATMIARLERFNQYDSSTPSFVDAMEGAWYNGAVNALVARNIMKGYPDGSFKADAEITRAEFAKIVSAINNKSKRTGDLPFADVRGHWAEDAITDAYLSGLIMGYPDGTFRPDQAITRAEVAKILNALYDRKSDDMSFKDIVENVNHFNDLNRSHWAYYELVEAANSHESVRRSKNEVVENWIKLVNNYK